MHWTVTGLIAMTVVVTRAVAADVPAGTVDVSQAWVAATTQIRGDAPLFMTIANHADAPDSLIRARCPTDLADSTAKHTNDRGEGGVVMREVNNLPIPAKGMVTLAPGGDHLMLLHVREPLQAGQTFTCTIVFQKAGTIPIEVKVASSEAKEAP